MIEPETFAAALAKTLGLFRDPAAKEEQKASFRSLIAFTKGDAVTLKMADGRVTVNDVALAPATAATLVQRLELHSVHEIALPPDPPAVQVFELLRALADQPGEHDIAQRLRAAGADRVTVAIQAPPAPPRPPAPPAPPVPPAPPPARKSDLGAAGVRGDIADSASEPPPGTHVSARPEPDDLPPIAREVTPAPMIDTTPVAARSTDDLLAELARDPTGPRISDILAVLGRQLETAMKTNRLEQAMTIVAGIVRAEQQIAEESRRRQYSIALKRMYTKSLLEGVAHLVGAPGRREAALIVLQRAGADGVEVLLDLLVAAPTIEERRGIFDALTGMKEGTDQLVHMLGHHQWFVVRNVAELVGELGLEEAVPALGRQLEHADERVRKAVALALAKIGSRSAAEPLRRALKDKSIDVRLQAALGVGGRKSSALAMPLVVAMGEEENPAVEHELMLALGRIGSPDAVQALIKFAAPGGKLFGRKPTASRVTAIEALRLAGTPAALGTLEGLASDGDRQVRAAAAAAVAELKKRK